MLRSARQAGSSLSLAALFLVALPAYAQQADAAKPADTATPKADDQVVKLSPFKVTTDKDKGYKATNTTSGTRLNTEIKDLPMPIEVITEQFIKDIGANDLRQSLQYSAGIQLQTQNDFASQGAFGNQGIPGRINNPEGSTANPNQSVVKIRGFDTEASLRDGFRRQNSTDTVNVARIDVIRGPNSLLYGVGNFGGVVNYSVKQPETKAGGSIGIEAGSYGLKRATLDLTGPISNTVSFRLTTAVQDQRDYTQYKTEKHWFVSPVISWKPWKNTEILLDTEFGTQDISGNGFQSVRAVPTAYVNDGNGYDGTFLAPAGTDVKRFRWSGPDTYNNSRAYNIQLKLNQTIFEGLNFNTGLNVSSFSYNQQDVSASLKRASDDSNAPAWAIGNVTFAPVGVSDYNTNMGSLNNFTHSTAPSVMWYQWNYAKEQDKHTQIRTDLSYTKKLFEDSKWAKMENMLLIGQSYTHEVHFNNLWNTAYNKQNYKNPTDYTPIRYGTQGDGKTKDEVMVPYTFRRDTTQDAAAYAVYQGKLLDGWVTLIAGIRKDRSWNKENLYDPQWNDALTSHNSGGPQSTNWFATYGTPSKDTTKQYGIDLKLLRDNSLSLYVMSAEAVEPNYTSTKDYNLNPLPATLGKDKEIGLKFDFFDGRVSGTISKFQIDRTRVGLGTPGSQWYAPTNSPQNAFNPNKDIVYQMDDTSPDKGLTVNNPDWWDKNGLKAQTDSFPAWNAGVAAGAIYKAVNAKGETHWYVDATKAAGATYMDTLYANLAKYGSGYAGWFYSIDSLTNNASVDGQNNHGQQSEALGADRSTGWDGQIMLSPTDDLQIVLTFSHIEKKVINPGTWIDYPYTQDRWAMWYQPGYPFLLPGQSATTAYGNPAKTSTVKALAYGVGMPLDDTPRNTFKIWTHYQMPKASPLHGLHFGLGMNYDGSGALYPIYGHYLLDANNNLVHLDTKSKMIFNGMVRYEFKLNGHEANLQMNIDNVLNNTDWYGFIANPPRKISLTYNQKL